MNKLIYLQPHRRKPVSLGLRLPADPEQAIPLAWCGGCGQELHIPCQPLCRRCKGAQDDEQDQYPQPLPDL